MPITVRWGDPQSTYLLCEFSGYWRWEDFFSAVLQGHELAREVIHPVSAIVDTTRSQGLPAGMPFRHLGRAVQHTPPNMTTIIFITRRHSTRLIMNTAGRLYGVRERIVIVESMDEALRYIARQRDRSDLHLELLRTLTSENHTLVLRAVDGLRRLETLYDGTLRDAVLVEVNLSGANLLLADMAGANLEWSSLRHANLSMVNFERVNLYQADLYGATLTQARLREADLRHTDLRMANLHGAQMIGARLDDALFDRETVMPDGRSWQPGADWSAFLRLDHAQSWYARPQRDDETLPSRPPDLDRHLPR